ncbi:MAG: Crp/Fnr family transcriptional regulator [Ignavibacteriae bacterium]|nr:MAG: Crp/Fnr family transcriptional regulator [Ignavibacteriota bacterium]
MSSLGVPESSLVEVVGAVLPMITEVDVRQRLAADSTLVSLNQGAIVIGPQDLIRAIPIVVEGTVKVSRMDEEGRELLLYYIQAGESCALTLVSFLCHQRSGIRAETLTPVKALMVPVTTADTLMRRSTSWQEFTYRQVRRSYDLLLRTIDDVAFRSLHERLVMWLEQQRSLHGDTITVTHQAIADDLGTSREVISRLLKQLEHEHMVVLGRNTITLRTQ